MLESEFLHISYTEYLPWLISEDILDHMTADTRDRLTGPLQSLQKYFPDLNSTGSVWITNPFGVSEDVIPDGECPAKEEFITLRKKIINGN